MVFPLALVVGAPPFIMVLWYTFTHLDGSLWAFAQLVGERGFGSTLSEIWGPVFFGSPTAWKMLGIYTAVQMALMRVLPGRRCEGPVTPAGHVPVYKANGVAAYTVTLASFVGASWGLGWFSPTIIYDHLGEMLGALSLFALVFCAFLYAAGRWWPSGPDHGTSGNLIFDYYWGTELYPRILGWDVKQLTNCRLAMMGWPLILLSFAAKQHELHGITDAMLVAVGLQLVYITKFFVWEMGYVRSLDIMHDRAGFYIVWGVLVWLPMVYTGSTLYLVDHPHTLGAPTALAIAALGLASIVVNYWADRQRQVVRATGGACRIFGRAPELIVAPYTSASGEVKESLLLTSGFWGTARHFNYLAELSAAFFWSLPVLFDHLLPWFYVIFLAILLTDRAFRDDARCAAKYGPAWETYCRRVRYRIVPGLL